MAVARAEPPEPPEVVGRGAAGERAPVEAEASVVAVDPDAGVAEVVPGVAAAWGAA